MKIRVEFARPYRAMRCTFCDAVIHQAGGHRPSWVDEVVGRYLFWRHTHGAEHQRNRPSGELAPAPALDPEAFERRATQRGAS